MLLHGLGGDRRQPMSLLQPALPEGAVVFAPDVRAHGTSTLIGSAEHFTLDALAGEVAASLPHGPLTILGISMGAALALRLALRGDLDIERLVFVRPAFTDRPLPANLAAFPVMGALLRDHGARRAEKLFRETDYFAELEAASPLGAEGAIEQFKKPEAVARALRLIEIPRHAAFTREEIASVDLPATVIAAERDPVHPVSVAELWHAGLPHSVLERVPARDDGMRDYVATTRAAVSAALAR
ncbi:alpha/beta fold hydrolase [Glaciihabitans arcticus]|uniref:alpha/beta fold hydrolase n=1 Tax=Glaciihabitans arcticus TaxID=2668039 RepID=UPI001386BB63|nr:alpha/beta fold hydrolase [Glaciihabitans arcticus]